GLTSGLQPSTSASASGSGACRYRTGSTSRARVGAGVGEGVAVVLALARSQAAKVLFDQYRQAAVLERLLGRDPDLVAVGPGVGPGARQADVDAAAVEAGDRGVDLGA